MADFWNWYIELFSSSSTLVVLSAWSVTILTATATLNYLFIPLGKFVYSKLIYNSGENAKLAKKKNRVEEIAGILTESLGQGYMRGINEEEARSYLRELHKLKGALRRNEKLTFALRDFENTVGWILTKNGTFETSEDRESIINELNKHYEKVINQL